MKNIIRIFSLLLALLMVASCFVACNKDKENGENGGSQTQGGGTVATVEGEYVSKLPDDIDWAGDEFLVMGQSEAANPAWKNFEISREELPDDIVGKAVWERNDAIKQKYNLVVTQELYSQTSTYILPYYSSNEDKYDMVMCQLETAFSHTQSGYYYDLTTLEYIDLDHPAWNEYTTQQLTFGTSLYTVSSDFNLQNKAQLSCIFYNREMARDAGDGYLEDIVANNEWTVDKYYEIIKAYASDASGNGTKGDEADIFGTVGDEWNFLVFSTGAGYRASTVTDGVVAMAGAGDQILNILDKVGKFFFDSQISFLTGSVKPHDYARSFNIFKAGRALCFAGEIADYDDGLNEVSFEFGVLPYPKYDSDQDGYYTQVNPKYSSLCAIPITVVDTGFAGFTLEALTEYSTDTSYNAYIEQKCKLQDSFDQRMADMYGLLFENPVYDLVIVGDFGNFKRAMMSEIPTSKKPSSYSNLYNKRYENAQNEIDEIMTDLGII